MNQYWYFIDIKALLDEMTGGISGGTTSMGLGDMTVGQGIYHLGNQGGFTQNPDDNLMTKFPNHGHDGKKKKIKGLRPYQNP